MLLDRLLVADARTKFHSKPYATSGILSAGVHSGCGIPWAPCLVQVPLHAGDVEGVRGSGGSGGVSEALLFICALLASRPVIHPELFKLVIVFVLPAQKERM